MRDDEFEGLMGVQERGGKEKDSNVGSFALRLFRRTGADAGLVLDRNGRAVNTKR